MSIHYLFLGNDVALKDSKLKQLKGNIFSSVDMEKLDCEQLDGHKLSGHDLKVTLSCAPALSSRRLVIIRRAEKLSKENLILLDKFLQDAPENPILVLEAAEWDMKSDARKSLRSRLQVVGSVEKAGGTPFDMMDALFAGRTVDALSALKGFLDKGDAEEQLMGAMVWSWSNRMKSRVSSEKYKKGLLIFQEADYALKRSRFPSREQALETAMVKLSSLLKA